MSNLPGSTTESMKSDLANSLLSQLARAAVRGGFGFSLVSVGVFATVAFGERWMYAHLGVAGAYLVWTALFILLGGAVFGSIVTNSSWRMPKFYLLWLVAFFAYAVAWVSAYFALGGRIGEWVGSLIASILMTAVFAFGFGAPRSIPRLSVRLFFANSAGYFFGSRLNDYVGGRSGMLLWGLVYGLFLGVGIGEQLRSLQIEHPQPMKKPS